MGSQPSGRTSRTASSTSETSLGIIGARRYTVSSSGGSLSIPSNVRKFVIKNAHSTVKFALNFNSDTSSNYYSFDPKEKTPVLEIRDSVTINAQGLGGDSIAEALFWG